MELPAKTPSDGSRIAIEIDRDAARSCENKEPEARPGAPSRTLCVKGYASESIQPADRPSIRARFTPRARLVLTVTRSWGPRRHTHVGQMPRPDSQDLEIFRKNLWHDACDEVSHDPTSHEPHEALLS